jgi:hypothetical protein
VAGRRIALIVAVDRYHDPQLTRLRSPSRDAGELAKVLADPAIGGFEVSVLNNEPEHIIRRRIDALFADRAPADTILLHIACHGVKDEDGHLYLASTDTEVGHLASTAVPAEFVCARMDHSRSRQIMLFLDCCYSGAISREMFARGDDAVHVADVFSGDGRGRVIITASSALEYAFEGGEIAGAPQASVFTSAMLRGLRTGEADLDGDGYITVDEIYDYVYDKVRAVTPRQTPGKWDFVQGVIVVARSPVGPKEQRSPKVRDVAWRPDKAVQPMASHHPAVAEPEIELTVDSTLLDTALRSRSVRAVRAARKGYGEAATSADPEVAAGAALMLARLARHLNDVEGATTWYRRGWAQGRTTAQLTLAVELAELLATSGSTADAGWFFRWVLDTGPGPQAAQAAVGLGDLLEAAGEEEDAQQLYQRAMAMASMADQVWPAALGRINATTHDARVTAMANWLEWLRAGYGEWVTFADEADEARALQFSVDDYGAMTMRVSGYEVVNGVRRMRGPAFVAALVGLGFRLDLRRWPNEDDLTRGGLTEQSPALAAQADDILVRTLGARPRYSLTVSAQGRT